MPSRPRATGCMRTAFAVRLLHAYLDVCNGETIDRMNIAMLHATGWRKLSRRAERSIEGLSHGPACLDLLTWKVGKVHKHVPRKQPSASAAVGTADHGCSCFRQRSALMELCCWHTVADVWAVVRACEWVRCYYVCRQISTGLRSSMLGACGCELVRCKQATIPAKTVVRACVGCDLENAFATDSQLTVVQCRVQALRSKYWNAVHTCSMTCRGPSASDSP